MTAVQLEEFERRLNQRLCWFCGGATCASHRLQRQCSTCRKKWSYSRLERRWRLAQLYSSQTDVHRAAQAAGCSYKTAAQAYNRFRTVLRFTDGELWRFAHPFPGQHSPTGAVEVLILRAIFENVFVPRIPCLSSDSREHARHSRTMVAGSGSIAP